MTDLIRRLALTSFTRASYGNFYLPIRTLFSSSGIGIDTFKLSREQHASRYAPSLDVFKKRFLESIDKSDSEILTEDLRNMIMSANNDQEIDGVIQALKKYSTNKVKFTDYHFGSPVMRLLYIQNKTDLAMQLYMDETLKNIFNDSASALVLMNKLIEEKRYDDAMKIFEHGSQQGFNTSSGRTFPTDVVMLAIESLFRQNTKDSLNKAKELVSKVRERDIDINPRTATMTALLAVQQDEPSVAMEVLGAVRAQNLVTVQNIRAICYADMGRIEEAINVVHILAEQTVMNSDRRRVFPLVMRHIRTAVEKSKDQNLLTRFEELSKFVLKNNRLSTTDLPEFISEPINRRGPNRQNTQQNLRGSSQRTVGNLRNQGGYNQFDNERRSQNSDTDGYRRNNENDRYSSRNRNEYVRQDGRNDYPRRDGRTDNFRQDGRNDFSRQGGRNEFSRQDGRTDFARQDNRNQSSSRMNRNETARRPGTPLSPQRTDENSNEEQNPWERSSRQ